jgi:hypothetical protein
LTEKKQGRGTGISRFRITSGKVSIFININLTAFLFAKHSTIHLSGRGVTDRWQKKIAAGCMELWWHLRIGTATLLNEVSRSTQF